MYLRTVLLTGILAVILFGCAGRWDLPFVWAYIVVMVITTVTVIRVVDPDLLQERAPRSTPRRSRPACTR